MPVSDFSRRSVTVLGLASLGLAGLAGLSGALAPHALAQTPAWPQRAVKFIIPFGAGAGADIGARLIADKLSQRWGKAVVIENRPGGDGIIAVNAFLSANDDHVLMFAAVGSFTVHPYQIEKLSYVLERDLLPIARYSSTIIALAASKQSGIRNLKELIARAKADPGKLNAALVPGITELVWDGFCKTEGLDITKVPYKDIVPAANDLAEGRLDVVMASYAIIQPVLQGDRATMLGVTSPQRVPLLPDVPTSFEQGVPSLELEGLVGLLGPKTMSQDLRNRIGADVVAVASDPEIGKRLGATGQMVNPGGAVEFEASLKKQMNQVAAIAKLTGMQPK